MTGRGCGGYSDYMFNHLTPTEDAMGDMRAFVRKFIIHPAGFGGIEEWRDYGNGWQWFRTFALVEM